MSGTGLGQKRQKEFDPFLRLRVFEKLTSLRAIYPAMSWEKIAWDISKASGIEFDRKYLQRLVPGPIPDSRVKAIIDWITDIYDPEFRNILAIDNKIFSDSSLSKYFPSLHRSWSPISTQEIKERVENIDFVGYPDGYFSQFSGDFYIPNFLPYARILRLRPLRPASMSLKPVYLLDSSGKIFPVEGQDNEIGELIKLEGASINHRNALDYIAFFMECVNSTENYNFISSTSDLIYHFMLNEGRSLSESSALSSEVAKYIEPPVIEIANNGNYTARVDAISYGHLNRIFIQIGENLSIKILNRSLLRKMDQHSATSEYTPSLVSAAVSRDIKPVLDILSQSESGRNLIKSGKLGGLSYIFVRANSLSYNYDDESNSIIVSFNPTVEMPLGFEAVALAYALRFADQNFLKLRLPSLDDGLVNYATIAHGKNLDAIVWACRVAVELQGKPHADGAIMYINRSGFKSVFDGVIANASPSELFDLYALINT